MKNTEVCTGLQESLKEIFGSIERGVFWIEEGNKLCKATRIDEYKNMYDVILPFKGENYLVIIFCEGKYKLEVRDAIGECSHASWLLLEDNEWCDSVKVLDNVNLLIICQNGRYGAIDIRGYSLIPFEYDAIYPIKNNRYIFEVYKGNSIRLYDIDHEVEYPSKVVYDFIKFLFDDTKNDCNLEAVNKFIQLELGCETRFYMEPTFINWLLWSKPESDGIKIDKFLRRIMKKGQYGLNNRYAYEEKLLHSIYAVESFNIDLEEFEKVFAECGKTVEFQDAEQLVEFIKDDANVKFFVKNYKKICEKLDLIE